MTGAAVVVVVEDEVPGVLELMATDSTGVDEAALGSVEVVGTVEGAEEPTADDDAINDGKTEEMIVLEAGALVDDDCAGTVDEAAVEVVDLCLCGGSQWLGKLLLELPPRQTLKKSLLIGLEHRIESPPSQNGWFSHISDRLLRVRKTKHTRFFQ